MAQRKKTVSSTGVEIHTISVRLEEPFHRRIRVTAGLLGVTLSELVREFLDQGMAQYPDYPALIEQGSAPVESASDVYEPWENTQPVNGAQEAVPSVD